MGAGALGREEVYGSSDIARVCAVNLRRFRQFNGIMIIEVFDLKRPYDGKASHSPSSSVGGTKSCMTGPSGKYNFTGTLRTL